MILSVISLVKEFSYYIFKDLFICKKCPFTDLNKKLLIRCTFDFSPCKRRCIFNFQLIFIVKLSLVNWNKEIIFYEQKNDQISRNSHRNALESYIGKIFKLFIFCNILLPVTCALEMQFRNSLLHLKEDYQSLIIQVNLIF